MFDACFASAHPAPVSSSASRPSPRLRADAAACALSGASSHIVVGKRSALGRPVPRFEAAVPSSTSTRPPRRWMEVRAQDADSEQSALLPAKPFTPVDLQQISSETLGHYNMLANAFWESTKDHDVSQNRAALLAALAEGGREPPYTVLDYGCGPGRDLKFFSDEGHVVFGLEGSAEFVRMAARIAPKARVLHQDMLSALLPDATFDGIFANASLFHIPRQELPRVLRELRASLRPRGVLFMSNPRGDGFEGTRSDDPRYGNFMDYEEWLAFAQQAGFEEVTHYYRPPGVPRIAQRWIALVLRRTD